MLRICATAVLFSALAFGAGWEGKLVDATCKHVNKDQACPVTKDTNHYGVVAGHRHFVLDREGDLQVQAALVKKYKDTGSYPEGTDIRVWVNGKANGDRLALSEIALK